MIESEFEVFIDNIGELLKVPGQSNKLRARVLDLAVSGGLVAARSPMNANDYLSEIVTINATNKPAKKVLGIAPWPLGAEIPETWASTMLGRIATDIRYGTSEKTSDSGEVPVLRMGNIQNQRLDLGNLKYLPMSGALGGLLLESGDLLFNRTNSPALVGKSAVFRAAGVHTFASYLIRVRLHPDVNSEFVNLWLGSPTGRAWASRVKTDAIGQSNINGTSLGQFPLALPVPEEQASIVEIVRNIFDVIDAFEARANELEATRRRTTVAASNALVRVGERLLLDQAKELIQTDADVDELERAVLGLAVSGSLVDQRPEEGDSERLLAIFASRPKKAKAIDSIDKPDIEVPFELPSTWVWTTLGMAGKIVGGGTPKSERSDCFTDDPSTGTPWFTPADLGGNAHIHVSTGRRSLTEVGLKSCSAQLLPAGAVLFSSRAPIGYVAILDQPASTNQGFKSFVPHEGLLSEFAYFWLRYWGPEIDAAAPSVTFREVNKKSMERQPVPIPPTAEQHRIVERVLALLKVVRTLRDAISS